MLIFLDIETSGLESNDRIISIGIVYANHTHYELVKPPKRKISTAAMAVHHITNEVIKSKKQFKDSKSKRLLERLNCEENTFVMHNMSFVNDYFSREKFYIEAQCIDTCRCARHLLKENESYALAFLRYDLGLYKEEKMFFTAYNVEIEPHNALSDALHVKMVYNYLLTLGDAKMLALLSYEKVLLQTFSFGKYKDRYIEEISMIDRGYLEWMLHNMQEVDEDLYYSLEYYLGGSF